jgi:hypothetical protein
MSAVLQWETPTSLIKTGKARIEHMISASHQRADICAFMNTPKRMAPTILHVRAMRDHPAAYLRRAFRSLVLTITASDLVQTMTMITFRAKATRGQFALAPTLAPPTLHRQRFARLHVRDDFVDRGAIKRAFDAQDGGQHDHEITVGHQQVTRYDVAVRDERFNRLLARADQQSQLARLPEIVGGRR